MKKQYWLPILLGTALALAGCSSDSSDGSGSSQAAAKSATGVFGVVKDTTGATVTGATVTIDGTTATTDSNGRYELKVAAGTYTARFTAPGYVSVTRRVDVVVDNASNLDWIVLVEAAAVSVDATSGGTATGARGAAVAIPAGALVDRSGNPVSGTVNVHLTPLDPSIAAELDASPGALLATTSGGTPAQLESFGMMDITIRQGDTDLDVAAGATLEVRIPAAGSAPPATIALWSYDEDNARWVEEGTATLDSDAGVYVAQIPHLSFWNADQVQDSTCVSGRTVDASTGAALAGARVFSRGLDYFGSSETTTRADGRWAIAVRKSSSVLITATHAEGGGVEREVTSGTADTAIPPSVDDEGCLDTGDWEVTRGVIQLSDGSTVTCDTTAFNDLASCMPLFVEVAECFSPEGECTSGGGLLSTDVTYANGAKLSTALDGTSVVVTWTGPGGVACGSQRVDGTQVTITAADGRTESFSASVDATTQSITYQCVDGSSRTLSQTEIDRVNACTQPPEDQCAPGGGGTGEDCTSSDQCGAGEQCCTPGICVPEALCLTGEYCATNADCGDGEECCTLGLPQCVPSGTCGVAPPECATDDECGGGVCCEGDCRFTATCAGECEAASDCSEDFPFCCPSSDPDGDTYCARSAQECYVGRDCGADTDCVDSELVCCEGQCRTNEYCYDGDSCTETSECGSLVCCDRSDQDIAEKVCESEVQCASFRACNTVDDCASGFGLVCCDRDDLTVAVCMESVTCALGQACSSDADCGGGCCEATLNICLQCE